MQTLYTIEGTFRPDGGRVVPSVMTLTMAARHIEANAETFDLRARPATGAEIAAYRTRLQREADRAERRTREGTAVGSFDRDCEEARIAHCRLADFDELVAASRETGSTAA